MSKKSGTPTRSSERDRKTVSRFQVEAGAPKSANFKKVVGHSVHDEHYVVYEVELNDGSRMSATDYDFKMNPGILAEYKTSVTQQPDNSDGEYAVEKVLAHRLVNGKPLYLVQWIGYPNPVWNSEMWESELDNCKNLLACYKSQSTPANLASNSIKKRSHSPSDDEDEGVELKSTPKKMNLNSAQSSRTRLQIAITTEEQEEDEEEETEPVVRRGVEIQEEVDEDEEDGIEEERVIPDDSQKDEQKKGWFSGFSFGKWF